VIHREGKREVKLLGNREEGREGSSGDKRRGQDRERSRRKEDRRANGYTMQCQKRIDAAVVNV